MKQNHQKSWAMAYCGIVAALCVALMLLGLHHAVEPLEAGVERENWEIP